MLVVDCEGRSDSPDVKRLHNLLQVLVRSKGTVQTKLYFVPYSVGVECGQLLPDMRQVRLQAEVQKREGTCKPVARREEKGPQEAKVCDCEFVHL